MTPPRPPLNSGPDQPERDAVRHPGVDGAEQPAPKRSGTLTGMPAAPRLDAPPLPPELAPTRRAPSPWSATVMRPTPPSTKALARRSDPPGADPLPPPPQDPEAASREALRRRAEAAEAKAAELERRERVREETASPNTFPPRVDDRSPKSTPSAPPDAALGRSLRYLFGRLWPLFLAAAGIGGGVTAVAKPTVDPAKADAVLASQQAMQADVALLREQVAGMLKREAARDAYVRCLEESLDEVGEQLLPAQDRLHNATPLRAYVKRCQRLRP